MTNWLQITISRVAIFYKQRELYFYPTWTYVIPTSILKASLYLMEAFVWTTLTMLLVTVDTTKRLMSSSKCRSVEVINNPARPGSNHREVNCINYK